VSGVVGRIADDALALCAIPAPTFAEAERGAAMAERLTAAGARSTTDRTGNVLARLGAGGPDSPAAIVAAHLDTVFPAGTPLAPRREGETLHGPGIGDDCLGLAARLHHARRLADTPPDHPILLAATVGEEGLGDLRGARAVLDEHACDAFVALEGHGRDTLQVAGIGSARIRARVTGPGGHSWGDRGTPSAVHALTAALAAAIAAAGDAHLNVGRVEGGTSINTIAAEAVAELDLRDADDAALEATKARVERALRDAVGPGVEIALEPIGRRPAGATPPDHPLVVAAREARAAAGLGPAEEDASSTDANAALGRGIPAVGIGLTHGCHAHRLDERVDLAGLDAGIAALDHLVDALGARSRR
jgi:acetylornithine deacetylase/succinyl-diaminopimelate desuccinylase-like protein